jgi:HK97 family phage major capsid protein
MPTQNTPQDAPRLSKLAELRQKLVDFDAEQAALADKEILSDEEEERWADIEAERAAIEPEHDKLAARAARAEQIKSKTYREIHGLPEVRRPVEELYGADVRGLDYRTARDGALKILEDREQNYMLSASQQDHMDSLVRKDTDLARRLIVTENEHYRSAFHKLMLHDKAVLNQDETQAMLRYQEYRAASEGTTTAGGFAIPVFIDPSVILTDQETDNPFLTLARQVTVNTNAWKGVSGAGVAWSFDAEAAAVSDDSVTIAQPSVTVFTARGFIPYSIEIGEDWPGFQSEMARLLAEGYDELLIDKFSRGSGSGEPRGILTALDANTNVEVVSTTDGAFGQEDIYKVWKSLPQKYRRKAAWMMSVDINNRIRQFGAANVYHAATVTLPAGAAEVLFAKPVYESPYFPDFTGTTGAENRLVVGAWDNYVIARRTGMSVELVPQLFDVTNNRPTGQRGWFAYARIGGNSVNDLGFRLLQNQ